MNLEEERIKCQLLIYLNNILEILYITLSFYNNEPSKNKHFLILLSILARISQEPKLKKKLKSRESFLRKVSVCTLTDLNPGFDGPWDILWIFL